MKLKNIKQACLDILRFACHRRLICPHLIYEQNSYLIHNYFTLSYPYSPQIHTQSDLTLSTEFIQKQPKVTNLSLHLGSHKRKQL